MHFSQDPHHNLENLISRYKTKSFSIYIVVVLAVVGFLVLLPIIQVDVSNQSRGILRSSVDNVPITAVVSGKITYINLKNNQTVHQGDTLLKITTEPLDKQQQLQDTLAVSANALLQDINQVLTGRQNAIQTATIREAYYKETTQRRELQSKVQLARQVFNRYDILFKKSVIAKAEHEKYAYDLRFAQEALASFNKNQTANWQSQKHELEEKIKNLKGTQEKLTADTKNYVIIAPTTGTIEAFNGLQANSFINASQPIAMLSPIDNLVVECAVQPSDIGLIRKNQKVKFQFDAFNYNQWGFLEGKVLDIDKNITVQENNTFFKVRCSLNSKVLQLKSGYKANVSKGMTLTTRYIIARRSLYDLLFDKVDDWLNPKNNKT